MKNNDKGTTYIRVEWQSAEVYKKIDEEINKDWPRWKQEVYNELFAQSAHANQIIRKE